MEYRSWNGKQFFFVGPQISLDRVNSFSQKYNLWLPECYKDFLVAVNGGRPTEMIFVVPGWGETMFGDLAGIDKACNACNLEWVLVKYPIPRCRGFIEIGYDAGGCEIFLKTVGATRGSVWFAENYGDEEVGNLWFVARSFAEFISNLHGD